jgi:hypothetical protein
MAVVVEDCGGAWVQNLAVFDGVGESGVRGDENAGLDELERARPLGQLLVQVIGESSAF